MIDCILQPHCGFFRVYVDDIVIYTKLHSLQDYLEHLNKVFKSLTEKDMSVLKKSFLNYLTVQLLNQCVDILKLTIIKDKLITIVNIEIFSHIIHS